MGSIAMIRSGASSCRPLIPAGGHTRNPQDSGYAARAGTAGIEFAAAIPIVLLLVFLSLDLYRLVAAQRALDLGVDSALRYAAMNGGTATADSIAGMVTSNAELLLGSAGRHVAVTVTCSAGCAPGSTVKVSASYAWTPTMLSADFISLTLDSEGAVRVRN